MTILGSHLTGATAVRFGTTRATHVVVHSAGKITARAPAHAAGTVHVRVTTGTGTSPAVNADRYTYLKTPAVTSVSPRAGPTGGGSTVTVNGAHFTTGARVMFGTTRGTHVVVKSATKLAVHTPAHAKATVDVRVRTLGGTSAKVQADRYTYR